MNIRTIALSVFVAMAASTLCTAQDLEKAVDSINAASELVPVDATGGDPDRPQNRLSRPIRFDEFTLPAKETAKEAIMLTPKVLEPNGEQVQQFKLYFFSGDTVSLSVPHELNGPAAKSTLSKPDFVFERDVDPLSPVAGLELPATVTSALIIAHEGFKVVGRESLLKKEPITLEHFSLVQGKVELKGPPLENVAIEAYWRSFPLHPELLNLPVEKRREGPGLFSIFSTASLKEDGTFEMAIPPGRVQFQAVIDHSSSDQSTAPILPGTLGVNWWETVKPVGSPEDDVQAQRLQPHSFNLMTVKGSLKQTDALAEALTQVKQVDGRVEVSRIPLTLQFYTNDDLEGFALGSFDQPLQSVIRRAAIWGRPGGGREVNGSLSALLPLPDSGRFSCVVAADMAFVSILKSRQVAGPNTMPQAVYESFTPWNQNLETFRTESSLRQNTPSSDLSNDRFDNNGFSGSPMEPTRSQRSTYDEDNFRVIDLGEIDLTNFLHDSSSLRPETNPYPRPYDDHFSPSYGVQSDEREKGVPSQVQPYKASQFSDPQGIFGIDDQPNPLSVGEAVPYPIQKPTADNPNDRAIANLVAQLLDTGDRRVRQTMKEPLKKMLEQRFDAEQTAREQLLEELRKRFDAATKQVKERATKREQIINDQLQRMLSLPEDDFEILPVPKQPNALFQGSSA